MINEQMSLLAFLNKCKNETVSQSEIYIFIKQHTNNFDKTAFEYLRNDLNLIVCNIKFNIYIETKNLNIDNLFEFETPNGSIYCYESPRTISSYIKEVFPEIDYFLNASTPRQKIQFVINDIEEKGLNREIFEDDYFYFLKFSDMVEIEYTKIIETNVVKPEPIIQNSTEIPDTIIGFMEFYNYTRLIVDENNTTLKLELESYDYLTKKEDFKFTIKGLFLNGNITALTRIITLLDNVKRVNERLLNTKTSWRRGNNIFNGQKEAVDDMTNENIKEINSLISFVESFISPKKQPKPDQLPKQPLSFTGLFKDEYIPRKELFYSRLETNGYIDKNHIWRETDIKNEPAKVYFWLVNNGVIKPLIKPTPALICFCKEFGITAYNDNEPTPPAEIRAVTIKNLLKVKQTISNEEKEHFKNVFLPFLIK